MPEKQLPNAKEAGNDMGRNTANRAAAHASCALLRISSADTPQGFAAASFLTELLPFGVALRLVGVDVRPHGHHDDGPRRVTAIDAEEHR